MGANVRLYELTVAACTSPHQSPSRLAGGIDAVVSALVAHARWPVEFERDQESFCRREDEARRLDPDDSSTQHSPVSGLTVIFPHTDPPSGASLTTEEVTVVHDTAVPAGIPS